MVTVSKARTILDRMGENSSDFEVEQVINTLAVLADLAINSYLEKRKNIDIFRQKEHN
jgi:hypothetical protein